MFVFSVQEQENQKQQLKEELEQLKTPQDSREASCQTPIDGEEVRGGRRGDPGGGRAMVGDEKEWMKMMIEVEMEVGGGGR